MSRSYSGLRSSSLTTAPADPVPEALSSVSTASHMPFLGFRVKGLHPICTQECVGLWVPSEVVWHLRKNVQDRKVSCMAESHSCLHSERRHRDTCQLSPFGCEQLHTCHLTCDYSMTPSPQLLPVLSAKRQRRRVFLIRDKSFVPRIWRPCPDLLSAYILCGHLVPISPGPCRGGRNIMRTT